MTKILRLADMTHEHLACICVVLLNSRIECGCPVYSFTAFGHTVVQSFIITTIPHIQWNEQARSLTALCCWLLLLLLYCFFFQLVL